MNNDYRTDELLRRALGGLEDPDDALLRQVKASLRKEQDMKMTKTAKRMMTLALAAALVLALGVTAYAALDGAEWFKSWFADQTQNELTEGQKAYVDQAAAGVGQSVTADGWTVTLESAMTDGQYCYMKLDIQAPEGTDADMDPFLDGSLVSTDPDAPENLFVGGGLTQPVDDGNGGYGLMLEKSVPTELREQEVDWSYPLVLTLDRLTDERGEPTELLSEGPWVFQFTVTPPEREEMELVTEPFTVKGRIDTYYYHGVPMDQVELEPGTMVDPHTGLTVETEEVDVTVTSLKLSPMGAVFTYEYQSDELPAVDPWELEITFAGSTAEIAGISNHWPDGEEGVCTAFIEFAAPIDLDEVTAVTFQGHDLFPLAEK